MRRRAQDQKNYMIGVNTWLFAVGAILAGYNTYVNLPSAKSVGGFVIGSFTQLDGLMLSSFAIMLSGFFYSLVILKPDMLKRNRERQLMKLKVLAVEHDDFKDRATKLYNGQYFHQLLNKYLEEFNALDETMGITLIEVQSSTMDLDQDIKSIADTLSATIRPYDVVARIDNNLVAVLTPYIKPEDIHTICTRFTNVILSGNNLSNTCRIYTGTSINDKVVNKTQRLLMVAVKNLQVGKRLAADKLAA